MKLNDTHKRILSAIAQSPRTSQHFTHGNKRPLHPDHVAAQLLSLVNKGLLFEDNGVFSITTIGRQRLDSKEVTPTRFVPTGIYKIGDGESGNHFIRPGANDAMELPSRGPF